MEKGSDSAVKALIGCIRSKWDHDNDNNKSLICVVIFKIKLESALENCPPPTKN